MVTEIFAFTFLLAVGNLAHCQDLENRLFIKIEELMAKQEAALMEQEEAMSQLKGMQEKLEYIEGKLQEMQTNQEHTKGKLQGMQEKQDHVEGQLQEIHQETKGCLGREDLEQFKNILSSGQQELKSSFQQKISGVISLLETGGIDECSEGSHNCSDHASCIDTFVDFSCLCLPGFTGDGSHCEDIDECTEGLAECSPQATCRNSVGSYSCSCNPPFDGDGRTCEFCKSLATVVEGLGCVKLVKEFKTFEEMKITCQQAGGSLLQNFTLASLQEVFRALDYVGWLGVHEGRWQESGLPLPEEFWSDGSRGSNLSERRGLCGFLDYDPYSDLYKVDQRDCSETRYGYCQLVTPQK